MPIVDINGNILVSASPTREDLARGAQAYLEWVSTQQETESSETSITKVMNRRQLRRFERAGGYNEFTTFFPHPSSQGRLSYALLRHLYETSPSIRPAVDGITREIAGLRWECIHEDLVWSEQAEKDGKKLRQFFNKVNEDNEDISLLIEKFARDYLVVGRGVVEKVRGVLGGDILELLARDAATFTPKLTDDRKHIDGYLQVDPPRTPGKIVLPAGVTVGQSEPEFFEKDDIIWKVYAPTTYTFMTLPIIETIVNEVSLIMLSTKAIAYAFMNDEIPPGILHLGTIGTEALERAKQSFTVIRGIAGGTGTSLRVVDNVDTVEWVPFQRPFREMQLAELLPIIERVVARNFGQAPLEANLSSEGGSGDAELSYRSSQTKMVGPLKHMIETMLSVEVVQEKYPEMVFRFVEQGAFISQTAKDYVTLQDAGTVTRNEVRLKMGFRMKKGGDRFTVRLGNEVVPLDPETGEPQYRNPLDAPPSAQQGKPGDPGQPPSGPHQPGTPPTPPTPPQAPHPPTPSSPPTQKSAEETAMTVNTILQMIVKQLTPSPTSVQLILPDMPAPVVHIAAPTITLPAPVVHVDVQPAALEVPAPVVQIDAPVTVQLPSERRIRTIERDEEGRIARITDAHEEGEEDEDE